MDSSASSLRDPNLRRLFQLRSLTIAVELAAIAVGALVLKLPLPMLALGVILAAMTVLNAITWWRLRRGVSAGEVELFLQLLLDVGAFTGVLWLTGGAANPFAWFYLIPLVISATLLPPAYTWGMAVIVISCYSVLMARFAGQPAVMQHDHGTGFMQHVVGMWFGFVLSATVVATFVASMARGLRERDRRLAEAREQALRDERLVAMGTLAAGAAHELGTPLGTMAIVVDELAHEYDAGSHPRLHQRLELLKGQLARCKQALSVLSASAGEARAEAGAPEAAATFLAALRSEWQASRPATPLHYQDDPTLAGVRILTDRTLSQALLNILNNAADASPDWVELRASVRDGFLAVDVCDQGAGLSHDQLQTVGNEPFTTKDYGLGVGLFLAHATIRRMGGDISHHAGPEGGHCTRVRIPVLERRDTRDK